MATRSLERLQNGEACKRSCIQLDVRPHHRHESELGDHLVNVFNVLNCSRKDNVAFWKPMLPFHLIT